MLDGEHRGHQGSTSNRLPIQTPGPGVYGKQQSGLDLAWALATPAAGSARLPALLLEGRRGTPIPHLGSAARGTELHGGGGTERK